MCMCVCMWFVCLLVCGDKFIGRYILSPEGCHSVQVICTLLSASRALLGAFPYRCISIFSFFLPAEVQSHHRAFSLLLPMAIKVGSIFDPDEQGCNKQPFTDLHEPTNACFF